MLVSEAVTLFEYSILRLSPKTQKWYMDFLTRFSSWCDSNSIPLERVKPIEVRKYLASLRETPHQRTKKPLSTHTVHGHARAIRAFLRWCSQEEGLEEYVTEKAAHVDMPKLDKHVIKIFTPDEIQKLIQACKSEYFPELRVRSATAILVLYDTGIRASELCRLNLEDVFLKPGNSYIIVFGKGNKEREVGLGSKASAALYKYIRVSRKGSHEKGQPVFLTRNHKRMSLSSLEQMLYRLGEKAGVEDCHPHKFRHTFAVNYLQSGGGLFDLARLMGHTTTEITKLYLENYTSTQARQKGISVLDNLKQRSDT